MTDNPYDPRTHYARSHKPAAEPQPVTWQASGTGETAVAAHQALLEDAAKQHGDFLGRVEGVADQFTNEGLQKQLSAFSDSQAGQVPDTVERFCDALNADADVDVAAALAGVATPGDAAQEMRNQRAIDRAERVLGQASDGEKQVVATKLLADADTDTVGAVAAELATMGVEQTVIEAALVEKLPELKAKVARRDKTRQATAVLRNNAGMVRRAIDGGSRLRVGLVDPAKYDPDK